MGPPSAAYEIQKNAEGIYAVIDLKAEPATVKELDRQLTLNESVLRTKVIVCAPGARRPRSDTPLRRSRPAASRPSAA